MSEEPKKRTITLTNRPPVKITESDWPTLASAVKNDHDGQVECQANRRWKAYLNVRQHADGRAIVYGGADYSSQWQGERASVERAGVLLDAGADVIAAINAVAATLSELAPDQEERIRRVARETIADLPAVEL